MYNFQVGDLVRNCPHGDYCLQIVNIGENGVLALILFNERLPAMTKKWNGVMLFYGPHDVALIPWNEIGF